MTDSRSESPRAVEADRPAGGSWDDAEVISVYTRAQALADGALVAVDDLVADESLFARQAGFVAPVALTAALAALVRPSEREATWYGQDLKGRLWDVLSMARLSRPRPLPEEGCTWLFPCIFWLAGREAGVRPAQRTLRLKAVLGPGDSGEPVVTLLLPEED